MASAISPLTLLDGVLHALAAVAVAAVAQLDGLVLARRRARRDDGPPLRARLQHDLDLDGRVAARVEDLSSLDHVDAAHSINGSGGDLVNSGMPTGAPRALCDTPRRSQRLAGSANQRSTRFSQEL